MCHLHPNAMLLSQAPGSLSRLCSSKQCTDYIGKQDTKFAVSPCRIGGRCLVISEALLLYYQRNEVFALLSRFLKGLTAQTVL